MKMNLKPVVNRPASRRSAPLSAVIDTLRSSARAVRLHMRALFAMAAIATVLQPATVLAAGDEPEDQYRVLDWSELIPADWEPPLVARAYDEVAGEVSNTAAVQELNGQLSALPGYVKPLVFEGNKVSEFLLVPFLPHQVRAHAHLDANQMIYVDVLEPLAIENPFDPIWIVGELTVDTVMTEEGPVVYRMGDAVTTGYEY